jgi:soluble lytic murein transglycosylase-like protein
MKIWVVFVIMLTILGTLSAFLYLDSQKKPEITSPLPLVGVAFPTLTPTLTPTPTPLPTPTPFPTPTPTPIPLTSTTLEDLFTKYASLYSVDKSLLRKIAACESGFNPSAAYGDYLGLFQFSSGAWINSRALMGEDTNLGLRTNAEESIKTAAFKISRGEQNAWPSCTK